MTGSIARPNVRDPGAAMGKAVDGDVILAATAALVVAIGVPVIWRGAPLGDDFNNCLAPLERGLTGFLAASWDRLGMVRPARFLEILLTTGVCRSMPFGVAIAVPLLLTLAVAVLVRGLLRDLQVPEPWPGIGGAFWLLQPLGTEAALWPAALHVPLGLVCALAALRMYRRWRPGWAVVFTIGAGLSVEQTLLALPAAAWLVSPRSKRSRAALSALSVTAVLLLVFARWPGADPRMRVGIPERIAALPTDLEFYAGFPAVGLGLHSIPLAIWWALPWSGVALGLGALLGIAVVRRLPPGGGIDPTTCGFGVLALMVVIVLANAPVVLSLPRQGSPRVFAPTWLVLAVFAAAIGAYGRWRRPRVAGALAGVFAAGALLSQMLSVSVRLASADFSEQAARLIASRAADGAKVAVCGIRRTVASPAPRGAFAVHEFVYDWSAPRAVTYYTGRRATFRLAGELWNDPCPPPAEVDAVFRFDELLAHTFR